MLERRRHERHPFERHLEVQPPLAPPVLVLGQDVSESGVGFIADRRFEVGVVVQLRMPDDTGPSIEAVVRNVRMRGDRFIVGAQRV